LCVDPLPDAGFPDAGPGAGTPAFDVIYVDEWELSYDVPTAGSVVIVNKGTSRLFFDTLHLKFIDDDSPTVVAIAAVTKPTGQLDHDEAAGNLAEEAKPVIAALPEERIVEGTTNVLRVDFLATGNTTFELQVSVVLQLDVSLPMTIHHVPGPVVFDNPLHATRVSVYR
jgi:hypothetical protein